VRRGQSGTSGEQASGELNDQFGLSNSGALLAPVGR